MPVRVIRSTRNARRKKTAAYVRVSTLEEEQTSSFEGQQAYYISLITSNPDWEFVGIYADRESGTHVDNREQFNKMVETALRGDIDIILCKSISRWSRNTVDALRSIKLLSGNHVRIIFEQENIDTSIPGAILQMNLAAAIAQSESESNSLNHKWTYRQNAAMGIHSIGSNHYLGYDGDGKSLKPNEDAVYVQKIYEDFVAGKTYSEIANELNAIGVTTILGKPFSAQSIKKILKNEVYKGDLRFQKSPSRDVITRELDEIQVDMYVTDHHEAIVSRDLWDKAQERINLFKTGDPRAKKGIHFLTQRVVCGECGSILRRRTNPDGKGGKVVVWKCKNRETKGQCACRYIREQDLFDFIKSSLNAAECTAETAAEIKKIIVFNDKIEIE